MNGSEAVTMAMLVDEGGQAGSDWARLAALVIADELASHDLDVGSPGWDGSQLLKVTNVPGTLCHISVSAGGAVQWECWPVEGRRADPACTAAMVLEILGGTASVAGLPGPGCRCAVSFTGAAGRILAGQGMRVTVRADLDQEFFEVYADLEVGNPGRPERGTVFVAEDGSILWRCRARVMPQDEGALDPAEIAGIVARVVAGAGHRAAWPSRVQVPSGD